MHKDYFENIVASVGLVVAALLLLCLWTLQCAARAGQRRSLGELDRRLVRDVGLSPAQVAIEVRKPFWRN